MQTVKQYQQALWQEILAGGAIAAPAAAIRDAFFATPRHHFIGRYRTWHDPAWRSGHLAEVYRDISLILCGDDNTQVASSCSQPSYILGLAEWLDVRAGHRVLEVGSGSGWLVAILAYLVGPAGQVTGVEIIPELAKSSRAHLAGVGHAHIHTGNGSAGFAGDAPYDRVIFTAAQKALSPALHAQVRTGGVVLAPILAPEPDEATKASVHLYKRTSSGMMLIGERPGYFVPLREPA